MIFHARFASIPEADIVDFIESQRMARLVTSSPGQVPHVGLYPFVTVAGGFEIHLRADDEQVVDLRANAACLLEMDEPLAAIPSDWEHPANAAMADQYYRFVSFECEVAVRQDGPAIAAHLQRVLERFQPGTAYQAVNAADAMYGGMIGKLALLEIRPRGRRVKFKLGQQRPPAVRRMLVERLRARGGALDARTADIVEQTLG